MSAGQGLGREAAQLRDEFDRQFAEAAVLRSGATVDLLILVLGGNPYAVRLDSIAYLAPCPVLAPLASAEAPAFLGLAGLRGSAVPVWDLAGLVGYPVQAAPPAWVLASAGNPRWAAAVAGVGGTRRVPSGDLRAREQVPPGAWDGVVCAAGATAWTVLDLRTLSQSFFGGNKR